MRHYSEPAHASSPTVLPRITLVACEGIETGVGRYGANLAATGLASEHILFKKKANTPGSGYDRVFETSASWGETLPAALSFVGRSRLSDEVCRLPAVHFLTPDFFYLAKYNRNSVGTIHDLFPMDRGTRDDYSSKYRIFFRTSLNHAKRLRGIASVSDWTRQKFLGLIPNLDITVIHHWTSDQFIPRDKERCRTTLGLPTKGPIVLSIGSEALQKNVAAIGKTMNILGPDYHLVRVGEAHQLAKALRYPRSATLREKVSAESLPYFYNAADVLLFPSHDEGFGFPVIESINSGTPVVVSDIPVFKEILSPAYPYSAPADSPRAQSELIMRLTDSRSNRQAVEWMTEHFGSYFRSERGTTEYRRFYSSVLSS